MIIELTNRQAYYEDEILKNIGNVQSDWDLDQLLNLLKEFGKRGSLKSKKALYDTFDAQGCNESWIGGEQIIEVDGIDGFLHVAEIIGRRMAKEEEYWENNFMLEDVKEKFGTAAVETAIEERKRTSENIRTYFARIKTYNYGSRETKEQRIERMRKEYPLQKLLPELEKDESHFPFALFGRNATDEDLLFC